MVHGQPSAAAGPGVLRHLGDALVDNDSNTASVGRAGEHDNREVNFTAASSKESKGMLFNLTCLLTMGLSGSPLLKKGQRLQWQKTMTMT